MRREPRWMFVVYSVGLGTLVAIAALIGGEPSFAIFALVLMTVFGVVLSFTPWGKLRSSSQDERERSIGSEAAAVSGGVLVVVILAAWLIELARGGDGMPYTWLAAVGGVSFVAALGHLNWRR